MLLVGIVFSAVAMLLGIVTKLPQGGGGLANNLMVLSFFLPAPPFPLPPTPPTKVVFDLEAAIAENKIFYMRNPVVTINGTQGPMPRPPLRHRSAGSSNAPAQHVTFTTPSFSFPTVSLSPQLIELCGLIGEAIGRIAVVFLTLSWPWLVIKYMQLGKEKQKLEKMEKGRKKEVEGLKEEAKKQLQAWKEEEKKWEWERADAKKRRKEDTENWKTRAEALKLGKEWVKEVAGGKLKKILEGAKKEKEGWGREKEELQKEKGGLEKKRAEEKKLWEKADDRAQGRIAELEGENKRLKDEAANKKKKGEEAKVAKKPAEEAKELEQKQSEEEATEVKKTIERLEDEVLNGRKLIEGLQADKRRDRQLLLELRAQLVRPNHAAPPSPQRFGGPSPASMGGPVFAPPFAFTFTPPPAIPKGAFHPILPPSSRQASDQPIPSPNGVNQEVGSEIAPLPPRPGLPDPSPPPSDVPKEPKGSRGR